MNLLNSKSGWNVERISQGHNVVGTVLRLAPCREILGVQRSALGQALPVVGGGRNCLDLFAKTLQERLGVTHGTNSAVIHHSCDSAGPLDTLRLANEELKRQLAPQSARKTLYFHVFPCFSPNTSTKTIINDTDIIFFGSFRL